MVKPPVTNKERAISTHARGSQTRQTNKELRRQRIMDVARNQIARDGFDAFTIRMLATEAGVTVPTVHNLFGKKHDIFEELCTEMVLRIDEVLSGPDLSDPIQAFEAFVDNLLALYREDEAFYRAAFTAGERIGLFGHEQPNGIYRKSLRVAKALCQRARADGYLEGRVHTDQMATQLFGCQRLARQDWVAGYIDLQRYRTQVLAGMCIAYAADATPEFRERLHVYMGSL